MIIKEVNYEFFWIQYDKMSDKRTRGWFLVDSPIPVLFLILLYLLMVWCGPKLMEKRKSFKIKGLLRVYNLFLVLLNGLIVKDIFLGTLRLDYKYLCHRGEKDYHPEEMRILNAVWWFFISKLIEFLETLFFILRKKTNQLSLLHVYHHSTMLFFSWQIIKWYPSGAFVRLLMLNSFIHVIMYSYYGLSSMGPKVQKYLFWKKYLTSLQLVQFVISLFWSINSLTKGCNHPQWIDIENCTYMSSLLFLFGKFYIKKYTKKAEEV